MTILLNTIWLDLSRSTSHAEMAPGFHDVCKLWRASDFENAQQLVDEHQPDWILLDFDYPSSSMLSRAKAFNQTNAWIPMVISTIQHSEAMAVWTLRTKFLDYLVKPTPAHEVQNCLHAIQAIREAKKSNVREPILVEDAVPDEISRAYISENEVLQRAIDYVEQNFHEDIRNEVVASQCNMSQFTFSRLFKQTYGIGFHEFLTRYRLREARRLLANPYTNIASVGLAAGFNDPSYFSRVFKKYYGQNPSAFLGKNIAKKYSDVVDSFYAPCPIERRK